MFTNWNFEVHTSTKYSSLLPLSHVFPTSAASQEPRQFWTLFPHTPDNSFLGFVVEPVAIETGIVKKNQGVVYGKEGECTHRVAQEAR